MKLLWCHWASKEKENKKPKDIWSTDSAKIKTT